MKSLPKVFLQTNSLHVYFVRACLESGLRFELIFFQKRVFRRGINVNFIIHKLRLEKYVLQNETIF
ncbi:hypothetical protein C7972_11575 [Arenibacter sp. ARW7G5Y1]|nr:hypothetical protein C7972_11575 [Arenibacter sp. ARW7G5Y1]